MGHFTKLYRNSTLEYVHTRDSISYQSLFLLIKFVHVFQDIEPVSSLINTLSIRTLRFILFVCSRY